jgi:HD superfamily phosphohydrolase
LSELLHGPIDLDKLDYVERDAHHCGVPYGNYLDLPRIIETMRVIDVGQGHPVLAFDARIIGSLEQFATARHELYANVYWHRAVRSATVMFKHVFFLLQGLMADEKELRELFYYSFTDDLLLARIRELAQGLEGAACSTEAGQEQQDTLQRMRTILVLLQAVSGEKRVLYKSVLERDQEMRKEFGGDSYTNQRQKANGLFEDLKTKGFFGPESDQLGEHNLLIDCHFHQFPKFNEVKIVNGPSETTASLDRLAPSLRGLPESFSKQACKIRIFVNPDALKLEYRSKGGRAKLREYLEGKFPKTE